MVPPDFVFEDADAPVNLFCEAADDLFCMEDDVLGAVDEDPDTSRRSGCSPPLVRLILGNPRLGEVRESSAPLLDRPPPLRGLEPELDQVGSGSRVL